MKNQLIYILRWLATPFVFIIIAIVIFTLNVVIQKLTFGEENSVLFNFVAGVFSYGLALIISFSTTPVHSKKSLLIISIFSILFLGSVIYYSNIFLNENMYNVEYAGDLTGLILGFIYINNSLKSESKQN